MKCNAAEQKVLHECLLHVHPVFRLIPYHRLRPVDHVGLNLLAPVRGQAVHEEGVGLGRSHHFGVHTPVGKGLLARFVLGFVAHAGPHIGGDKIRILASLVRILEEFHMDAVGFHAFYRSVNAITAGRAHMDGKVQQMCRLQPGVGHVVAVTHPGNDFSADAAPIFLIGKDVGQHLTGMVFIGKTVDDRHA